MSRVLPYGDRALLAETANPLALVAELTGRPGVLELIPAARTVLVEFDPGELDRGDLVSVIEAARPEARPSDSAPLVMLGVTYDGADLDIVASLTGLGLDEVIARHCAATYTVAFCGFAPGFAYLTGLDPTLRVPRRATPRTSVPAGSVAIAGEYTGVYPRSSPGGWQLIGHTDVLLWDSSQDPPALLTPGQRVRFSSE